MIEISLSLTARDARLDRIKDSRTLVIDVLRATTVILSALRNGAEWVLPVGRIEDAWMYKEKYPDAILGGERDAVRIPGFDTGNSPLEYTRAMVQGHGIILTTTNGTQALGHTKEANEVLIAAFINMSAIIDYLTLSEIPVHILCAGTRGEFSMDDFLCAGGIISGLGKRTTIIKDDLGTLAQNLWDLQQGSINETLQSCKHFNKLKDNGFTKDLDYCLQVDTCPIIPKMDLSSGFIRLAFQQ